MTKSVWRTHQRTCRSVAPTAAAAAAPPSFDAQCLPCGLRFVTQRTFYIHQHQCPHARPPSAAAAAAAAAHLEEAAGGFDADDEQEEHPFPLVAASAAAAVAAPRAPTPPPPPPPPPPDATAELEKLRLFLADWALQHHISAAAITQLLQFLLSLFLTLGLLLPKRQGETAQAAIASAAAAAPRDVQLKPAAEQVWPRTSDKLVESVVTKEALALACHVLCPNDRCGQMLLDRSRQLTAGQRCDRPLKDITERPLVSLVDAPAAAAAVEMEIDGAAVEEVEEEEQNNEEKQHVRRSSRKKATAAAASSSAAAAASSSSRIAAVCDTVLTGTTSQPDAASVVPRFVFTYRSLLDSLTQLLQRPGIEKKCEQWRHRYAPTADGTLKRLPPARGQTRIFSDLWDGQLWEDYQSTPAHLVTEGTESLPMLCEPGMLALALNLDWYQVYGGQVYSMGAVYMTVLNLPREERYLTENMIQVGSLPGPKETPRPQLQGALKPLRDELLQLYAAGGVTIKTADHPDGRSLRAFLLNVVCDIPATRTLCGFARESSGWGCPYCAQRQLKRKKGNHADWRPWKAANDTGDREEMSLGSFERIPKRTHQQHVEHARAWSEASVGAADSAASIETAQTEAFKEHGARWSWLLDLPYWDSIRCMPIDVMHNILLGTCKHIMALMTGKRLKKAEWAAAADDPAPAPAAAAAAAAGGRKKRSKNKDRKKRSKKKGRAAAESEVEDNSEDGTTDDESSSASSDESAGSEGTFAVDQPAQPSGPDYSDDSSAHDSDDPYVVGAVHVSDEAKDAGADDEECKETDSRKRKTKRSSPARNAARKKRQRKHKARRSFNVNNPGASEIILSKSDLSKIQGMLDRSHCPRDIGRIPHKLESLSQIKASEWMNFFGIFAVPMIRELMRDGHERLTVEHLEIFILMQLIVAKLREYAITEEDIETLHKRLFKVTQLVAAAFPGDEGSVSPNMHLSLHLRQQLLDYGVAASCWTDPYERFNGLLSRLPLNLAMPAYSTARRTCKLVAVAGAEAAAAFGQPLPDRRDYFEAPNRPDDCKLTRVGGKVQYEWTDVQSYLLHVQRRQGRTAGGVVNVKGDEPFAGELRCRTSRPFRLTGITAAQSAGAPCLQFPQRRRRTEVQTLLVRVSHLLVCLQVHYLETRKEDILALVDADDTLSGEEQTAEKESLQDTTSLSNRQKALKNRYVLQYFGTLDPEVRMYDTLVMGSETYGSAGGRNRNSSYVAVAFPTGRRADGTDSTKMWYGQVSYYICHKYNHIPHFFAVCRWFLWQGQQSKDMEDSTAMDLFFKPLGPLVGQSSLVKKSFRSFPILTPGNNDADFNPAHADDIVPVQRIAHRWIPTKHRDTAGKEFHLVGSIPTRLHA